MTPKEHVIAIAEASTKRPFCSDFMDVEGYPGCCNSCHDDDEEYNYEMCHAYIPTLKGEIEVYGCCAVTCWLNELFSKINNFY